MKSTCTVDGCDQRHYAKGGCRKHWMRLMKFGSFDLPPRQVDLPCSVTTCDRNAKSQGYCGGHWKRLLDHGDVRADIPLKPQGTNRGPCSVPICSRKATAVGMCHTHRGRVRKSGDAMPDVPLMYQTSMAGLVCSIDGCGREARTRGWCGAHYIRWIKRGDVCSDVPVRHVRKEPEPCSVPICERAAAALGWCNGHYYRWLHYGDVRPNDPFRGFNPGAPCDRDGCTEPQVARGVCHYHYGQVWRTENADKLRDTQHRRRARMAGNPAVPITPDSMAAKISYWGQRCWICRGPYNAIDHVKPVFAGGAHMLSNLRPICITCNSSKGHKWPYPTQRPS